jgi:putative addiction module component (TIGR02574 family)
VSTDIATTLDHITAWPVADQIELLHQAWDRLLDLGWTPELTEAQKAELDRRLDDTTAQKMPLDKVIEHVRRRR